MTTTDSARIGADLAPAPDPAPTGGAARKVWQCPRLAVADIKELTARNNGSGTDSQGRMRMSDRRLKRDIRKVGRSPSGIPVYVFRYLTDDHWWLGAVAQDLLGLVPRAVVRCEDGMLAVDYAMVDVPCFRL